MKHDFADGKYTVINDNGILTTLRHGEPWGRDLTGDNLVYWMLCEVDLLKKALALQEYIDRLARGVPVSAEPKITAMAVPESIDQYQLGLDAAFAAGKAFATINLARKAVGVADEQDTARLDWVLPIITGEDDDIANNRTIALAGCLAHGRNGRDTIDLARKVVA